MTGNGNPFAYPTAITLDTLPDLLDFHRATFGGYHMEDDGGDKGGGGKDDFKPITTPEQMSEFLRERDLVISQRVARERERFADYDDLKAKAAEYDKALDAAKTEQEKAVEAARNEGKTEALTAANTRLVSAEARALAAGAKFRDPADAVAFLDLKDVKVNDDGSVDADAIKAKLKTLAESKPYLVDDGKGGKPRPDRSQGGGGDTDKPSVARGRELYEARHPKKAS